MARKNELTSELSKKITDLLRTGATIKDTCAYVGIAEPTYYAWIKRGTRARVGDEAFVEFSKSATAARAEARVGAVAIIKQAIIKGSTDDAKWFLERSDPANWGKRDILISLGIDPQQLRELKKQTELAGVEVSEIFEQLIAELANAQE